ncbi:putative ribonuclease H-like domain-containing protein, partial [Tanacetum coccineum]
FIQICLDMQRHQLQQHTRSYTVPSLSMKVFNNMKRPTKGYSGQEVPLFPSMLDVTAPSTSPSRITSSPSQSLEHSPSPTPSLEPEPTPDHTTAAVTLPSPTQPSPTLPSPGAEHHFPTPYDSLLHVVDSHGSDEGSLTLNELMNLVTKLSDRIGVLEADLKKTKQTYNSAYTKLILRVKKLESQIKIRKARRQARVVLLDDEDIADDSSKQGRKLSDAEVQDKARSAEVSTAGAKQGTASEEVPIVSTAEVNLSTAGGTVTYTRRSAEKAQDKTREKAQIARDEEITRQWDEEERQRAMAESKSTQKIDWNDPSVLRYQALKMKPKTVVQARRNMIKYLKNQGNYKISNFKGMSYDEIRLIFDKVWDFNQKIEPMEHGPEKMKSPEKIVEEDVDTQEEMKEVVKEPGAKRKKSIPRKSTRKRQKMEEDAEKEELKGFLDIIPREEVPIEVESISTKFPIVDWKTCVLTENFMYYQVFRGDGSSKNYKVLSEMLEDFDKQEVEELYRLVKERYSASRLEGYDLMLWGDLHTLFEPDKDDEIWKNQHEYNVISWSLNDFYGIHMLLMQNGIAIHMLTEKRYPLSQEMISKMLKKKLEVDHESSQAFELLRLLNNTKFYLAAVTQTLAAVTPRLSCSLLILNTVNPENVSTAIKWDILPENAEHQGVKTTEIGIKSDMAEEEIQANIALMAFSDSEVTNDKSCSKFCLKNYEALKKQYDDLLVKLDDTGFKASTYKRGHKEYLIGLLRTELEKVKEEKEGFEFKIAKFEKSLKDLDNLLASQVTDKRKKGFGYNVVPSPHHLILNRPTPLDLSYSGLEEFKQHEINEYGPRDSSLKPTTGCDKESDNSKENTDDSLKQQQKTASETSFVKSPLKVDKDWKEKFFYPANHVREEEPKKARENTDAPIIEDWVSDDEEEVEPIPKVEKKTAIPTATKKESVKPEKPVRRSVRYAEMYRSQGPRGNQRNWNGQKSNQLGCNFVFNNKACFICGSFDHIQYSCPNVHKHMAPRAVLMKTGLKTVNTARPVNTVRSVNTGRPFSTARSFNTVRPSYTAHPKSTVHCARPRTYFQNQAQSTVQRPFYKRTALTKRSYNQNVNTGRQNVNTVRARGFNAVKPSALSNSQLNDKGFVDSGCSRHMSGNIAHLSDFKDFDRGYVTFGGGANGGRITGKGTIKTDKLDFDDVYFVKELKFNLFSVSQMCDKKNYVLFTDSECLVLSPNFKLPDENQILLKIPRQDNMYSFDMKNIVPKDGLTCLVAKATSEESMLWHRRLGHVNFKNINKLVKENLVRDLPLKRFENDQTCVACLKGKQHRASCKTKAFNPITKPLFMLHMDLFGPTFDETSEILKNFIKEIENLVDKKVKIIRSDNGTEFKNKVMDEFCREKGIKREYSVARTPQQNGVAERKNRTLIEAARTMVLIVKPHNKTPYELFRSIKPSISFMKPFGCHVTILNTLDKLGKFDGKSDEGFFVGYSLISKAFRVYNIRTRKVQENLHIGFLENKPMIEGNGPKWLFDLDSLTQSMNYVPVVAGTFSNDFAGIQGVSESSTSSQQD